MNPYDAIAIDGPKEAPAAAHNPYDQIDVVDTAPAKVSLSVAIDQNPGDTARAVRLARQLGAPFEAVNDNLAEAEKGHKLDAYERMLSNAPKTTEFLALPDRAGMAHDDVENLTGIESAFQVFKNSGRAVAAAIPQMNAGLWGAAAAPFELLGADTVGGWLREQQKITQGMTKAWGPQGPSSGNIESGWYSGLTSAGQNLLSLPMAFLPGGQNAALSAMVAPVFGESYGKARDKGLTPLQGINYGAQDAVAEWAGERLGLGSLVKNVKGGSGFGKTVLDYLVREVPSEMATTLAQSFNEYTNINPDKAVGDWLQQLPDELAKTVVATLVGGGAITTAVSVADRTMKAIAGKQQDAEEAGQMGDLLARINKLAEASTTRERDTVTAQGFFQSILEEGRDSIYITPEALAQSGLAEQMAQAIPAVAEQLGTAAETGHDIRIPIADLMATMAGPELEQSILPHVAVEPGGFTPTTAQEYLQSDKAAELQAEVERVLSAKQGDDAFKASADVVKTNIKEQLGTAGRFTESVNDAYASMVGNFYAVQAARMGTTPEAMFKRYPLRIGAESVAGQQFEQSALQDGSVALRSLANEGNNEAIVAQSFVNSTGLNTKELSDILEGVSGLSESDRLGSVPSLAPMLSHMRGAILNDPKVFDAIVGSVPVDMVNNLFGSEAAAKVALHDEAMNENSSAFNADLVIAEGVDAADPVGLLVREAAFAATKVARKAFGPGLESQEGRAAMGADKGNSFSQGSSPRATFNPSTLTVTLLKGADLSSFLHESGHFFLEVQADLAGQLQQEAGIHGADTLKTGEQQVLKDMQATLDWFGVKDLAEWGALDFEEKRSYHERFARGFEAYLFEGQAPAIEMQGVFQRFRAWLLNVYRDLKALNVELTDEVRGVFDRMLATSEQIVLAEQGRSMMPLFTSPEQIGMTPAEFADYQALGVDATNEAIQELQARGLRDMQWIDNARGRIIKELKKEAAAQRAEVQMEVRAEIMSQPIYRAWQFLTGKITADDKIEAVKPTRSDPPGVLDETLDSLFVAIGKLGGLNKEEVVGAWSIDPADKPQSRVFGKPLWRIDGGLSIDGMAEALSQYGYLEKDEHGKWDIRELEEKFKAELGGDEQHSTAYDYAGQQQMRPGEQVANLEALGAGRLDRAALAEIGLPAEIIDHLKTLRMTAQDGLHPDIVAEMFGFSSGDELTRRLAAAETPKDEINALTDQRMLERYGDLSSEDAIKKAADKAIHNEARARMIATELNVLEKATGGRKTLAAAAREYAAAMIARLKVRDIKPGQYASAEIRAGKAAEKASRSGDIATAAAEQRNRLINNYATRAAYDAQDEILRALRYLKKFDSAGTRKGLDVDYTDQIDALLERVDLRKGQSLKDIDKRASFAKWLEAQREAGMEPDVPDDLVNEAFRKSYKDLTVEEMRGLVDTVKQIEHLGRLKHKLLTAKDQREFAVIVDEAEASIRENGGEVRDVELESPTGIKPWLEGIAAGHRKFASLLRQMDGGKDGGPLWRILGRSMNEAATAEAVMLEQATVRLAEIYKPILAMKGGTTGDLKFIPAINASLTRGGRLAVALNWGNETNRSRIMDGDKWRPAQVNAVLSTLTKEEWKFVQNVWDYIDSYWPQIAEKERRVTGIVPEKVKASPFAVVLPDGSSLTLRGGYYPIKYDANRDDRAEKHDAAAVADDMKRGAFTRSTTRRGHTKERVENVKRPVKNTLDVITQHVSEVAHDLSWHEWLIDANRVMDAKPINNAIREHYGTEVVRTMKDMLTAIATADIVPQTKIDQALLYLRANVSRSTMGLSLTTAFLQPFGLTQSMVRIGPKHVLRGMARWGGDLARFQNGTNWIKEKSEFMRLRSKTFNRELHEIKGRVSHGHSRARQIYDASLFMLMQKMQMVADVPTWIGAYEKATAENHDEATAVAMADQAVLDSQGGGQTKDMAEFQRKHPMLTMFYSYFNVTANLAAESTAKTDFKDPMAVAGWMSDMALLMIIPALGPALLLELMRGGGDDDPEKWAKKLASWQVGYLLGTVIGVREASGLVSGFDYAGPPVGRVIADLGNLGKQVAQGDLDESLALSSIRLMGTATGIPTVQIIRSWRGWQAWSDGDAAPTAVLLGPPPKD